MKKCPNCNSEVEDNYDVCWNCQYSFIDEKVLNEKDFNIICPKCNSEVESSFSYCPKCRYCLVEGMNEREQMSQNIKRVGCLRCKVVLSYNGNYRFHEGTRVGALGNLFELFTNRESFDLYSCPNCGKVEFFLPGYE